MKKKSTSKSASLNPRVLTVLVVALAGALLAFLGPSTLSKALGNAKPPQNERDVTHEDPAARAAWERLQWQDARGRISPEALRAAYEYKKTMPFRPEAWAEFSPKNTTNQPEALQSIWTSIGPGNIGGRTRSMIIHPTNSKILWLGAVGGGVWKTTDGGESSWSTTTDFLANLAVNCMTMDPVNNPNVLYAGTGEPYPFFGIRGNGIFKTTDGGGTWTQLDSTTNNPDFYDVTRLAIATVGRFQFLLATTTTGLFRSFDGGFRWIQEKTGRYNTVVFQPNNGANCLAASGLTSSDSIGVFWSTDSGSTWSPSTITGSPILTGRIELAYARSDPNGQIVYASADTDGGPNGLDEGALFKSTDGGRNFAATALRGTLFPYGWYANTLWVDPTNPNVVVVGGPSLYRSTDGGATKRQIATNNNHADHHVVINDPNYNGTTNRIVFVGNDGGIYKTTDILANDGGSWKSLNHGLGITQFYGGAATSDGSTIIGGTQDNGTLRYQSNPEGWTRIMCGDGGMCAVGGGYFYGEIPTLQVFRSSDGSDQCFNPIYIHHFSDAACGDPCGNWAAPLVLDPNNANTLLAGGLSLWRSNNPNDPSPANVSWTAIKAPIPTPTPGDVRISAVAVAPGFSDVIWVGHNNGALYFTTNGTATNPSWTLVNTSGLPQTYCESISFGGRVGQYNNVYVAFGGLAYGQGFNANNLWKTINGGQTWTNISNGLPSVPIHSIVTSTSNPGYLYIGTAVGVFASTDDGATWSPGIAGDVPANVFVDQLFWTNSPRRLVAVTHGRGMFTATAQ